jgi:hypothetical protein
MILNDPTAGVETPADAVFRGGMVGRFRQATDTPGSPGVNDTNVTVN